MASRKTKKKQGGKQRAQRATSNVFSMFDQSQIQEFKEAFTMIDANRDGFIDQEDLKDTYASLGRGLKDDKAKNMLADASGPLNFQVFLALFGDKLSGTDPEETILQAFKVLDPDNKGVINKDYLADMMMTSADRFSRDEVQQMYNISPIDAAGMLDYKSLCYIVTHGQEEEQQA
ncbi:myosin regulatory light chain, smooth muscle isoform X3 [Styela clava]|uniref:myosin regulatory light chain, smooth muscle n=1 Tax=Styela clava TaxID=7725 RepID=UPI00193960AD|nr:myosin regulatory light chain, smooth muscle [Styela clava]